MDQGFAPSANYSMQLITTEPNFLSFLEEPGSFWLASRDTENEEHLEYTTVDVAVADGKTELSSSGISVELRGNHTLYVDPPGRLCVGPQWYLDGRSLWGSESLSAIASTLDGSVFLVGTAEGNVFMFDTAERKQCGHIEGAHLAEIRHIVVFPLDKVFLTVGSDFTARIWSILETGRSAREFRGQKGHISDLALVGTGRNFLTLLLDGSVTLWECGLGQAVHLFRRIQNLSDPATCLCVLPANSEGLPPQELHFDTNRLFYVGYESGTIQQFHMHNHHQTRVRMTHEAAVSGLALVGDSLVAGYQDGSVRIWTSDGQLKETFTFSREHPVTSLTALGSVVCFSNGPDLLWALDLSGQPASQLVGLSESFRVRLICAAGSFVVATRDELASFVL